MPWAAKTCAFKIDNFGFLENLSVFNHLLLLNHEKTLTSYVTEAALKFKHHQVCKLEIFDLPPSFGRTT